jgi:membrane protein implicated in regulation of membrane protease activity
MWIWLVIAGLAASGELLWYDLFLAPIAAAAVVVVVMAPVSPFALQITVFGALSLLGIMVLRPIIRHALGLDSRASDTAPVGHDNVVGRRGIVTQTVDADSGQIRIGQSEFWTARSFDPNLTLVTGESVDVVVVDGIAALVEAARPRSALHAIGSPASIEKGIKS